MSDRPQITKGVEVMRLVACGFTDDEICAKLYMSNGGIKSRIKALLPVIGARNRPHAVALLIGLGLLLPEDINAAMANVRFRTKTSEDDKEDDSA